MRIASIFTHGKSFIKRLKCLSPLMGGLVPTAKYLFRARGKPMEIGHFFYNATKLQFRNSDTSALKEVLVDEEYNFLRAFLQSTPEPFILDIGAHIGTFSLWAYCQNPKLRMLMLEANPFTYNILVNNVTKIFSKGQYEVLNKAAWRNADSLKFSTIGASMGNKVSLNGNIEVGGITFSEIIEKASKVSSSIDLMKVDIEGAEEAFFETADLIAKVKHIVIELHPEHCNIELVRKKLKQNYKKIQEISNRISSKPLLYCTND